MIPAFLQFFALPLLGTGALISFLLMTINTVRNRAQEADSMVVDALEKELEKAHQAELAEFDAMLREELGMALPWDQSTVVKGTFNQFLSPGLGAIFAEQARTGIFDYQRGQSAFAEQQAVNRNALERLAHEQAQHQCVTHEEFMARHAALERQAAMYGMDMSQMRQMTPLEQLQNQMGLGALGGLGGSALQSLLGNAAKSPKSRPE